ncbi:MAG: nuclease-related domain-containing protein [Propionibacteriales bacterium]|nr:nuclease-related domain-containing protein [Propionibacteriales bacterium]
MAGDSARERARRTREKAERLQRSAEKWEKGAEGEARTAEVLAAGLGPGWTVLHDVRWPGRQRANVDHVAVGPTGIFVIDSKNWSGRIALADGVLLQNGRRRQWAVDGCADAASAVALRLPDLTAQVEPVLCFTRDDPMHERSRGVLLCSTATLIELLTSRPTVWDAHDVRQVVDRVRSLEIVETEVPVKDSRRRRAAAATQAPQRQREPLPPSRTQPQRRRRRAWVARAVVGLLAWLVLCSVAFQTLSPFAREADAPELLFVVYLLLALAIVSALVPRRRRRRRPR